VPDIPAEAVRAAMARRADLLADRPDPTVLSDETLTRLMLEAAAPLLAGDLLRPLLKRHPRIDGEWGPSCGTCWIRGGSRAAWPCAEVLTISVLLPIPDDEGDSAPAAAVREDEGP
jgi:hypothetical protein